MVIDLAEAGQSQREGTGSKFSFQSTAPPDLSHTSPDGKVCWRPWFQPRGWSPLQLWLGTQGLSMERQPGALLEVGEPGTCSPNRPICTSWLFIPFSVPPVFSHQLNPLVREQQFGCRDLFHLMKTSWVVSHNLGHNPINDIFTHLNLGAPLPGRVLVPWINLTKPHLKLTVCGILIRFQVKSNCATSISWSPSTLSQPSSPQFKLGQLVRAPLTTTGTSHFTLTLPFWSLALFSFWP